LTVYLKTHILPMDRGDGIVLELPREDGELHLGFIDCHYFEVLDEYLRVNGLNDPDGVDFIVVTHPHWDHIGGILPLLEKFQDKLDNYWESGFPPERSASLTHDSITRLVENNPHIDFKLPRTGHNVQFGELDVLVLAPPELLPSGTASDINNSSIVMRLTYDKAKLLFAGDAQFGNWAHCFVNQQDHLGATILKVSHHGSKHGTFLEALEAIGPKIAVITGINNLDDKDGKFPHTLTMDAINELNVRHVFCTYNKTCDCESDDCNHIKDNYITIRSTSNSYHTVYQGPHPDISQRPGYRAYIS
jgi:beta-lactamase superfamily II metal-dependent hydrolase